MQKKPTHYFVVRSPFAEMILSGAKIFEFRSNAKTFAEKRLALAVAQSKGAEKELEEEAEIFKPYFEGKEAEFEKALNKARAIFRKGIANGMVIGEVETGKVSEINREAGVPILKARLWAEKEWVKSPGGLGIRYMPGVPRGTEAETAKKKEVPHPDCEKALILGYTPDLIPDLFNGNVTLELFDGFFPVDFEGKVFVCETRNDKENRIVGMFETRGASKFSPQLVKSMAAQKRVMENIRLSGKNPKKELQSLLKNTPEFAPPFYLFPVLHPRKIKPVPLQKFMETDSANQPQKRLFPECLEISLRKNLDFSQHSTRSKKASR